jgi:hypothetical protein
MSEERVMAYRIVEVVVGCGNCGAGKMWDVEGQDGVATGTTYGDKEMAEEIAELMSDAYKEGQQSVSPKKRSLNAEVWDAADYDLAVRTHDAAEAITRRLAEKVVNMVYFRYLTSNSELDTPEKEIIDDVVALAMGEEDCEQLGINGAENECENGFVEQKIFELLRLPKPAEPVPFFDFLQPADGPVVEGMEEVEVVYAANQPPYRPLRTLPSNGPERKVLSRWTLTDEQRAQVLRGADVFLELMTFGTPLQPIRMGIGYKPNPAYIMNLMWPDQSGSTAERSKQFTAQERMDHSKETFEKAMDPSRDDRPQQPDRRHGQATEADQKLSGPHKPPKPPGREVG